MRTENEIRSALAALEREETGPNADESSIAHKTGVAQAFRWVLGDSLAVPEAVRDRGRGARHAAAVVVRDRLFLALAEADAALANAQHARDGAVAAWARARIVVDDLEV